MSMLMVMLLAAAGVDAIIGITRLGNIHVIISASQRLLHRRTRIAADMT